MSKDTGKKKLSDKGLLTPDNCVLALIDLQPQMLFGVSHFDRASIINNNGANAKAAKVFGVAHVEGSGAPHTATPMGARCGRLDGISILGTPDVEPG